MLKFKSALLAMMLVAATGFISCSNNDDDDGVSNPSSTSASWNNTFWGTWSLSGTDYPIAVTLTDSSFTWVAQNYSNGMPTVYNFIALELDTNGNKVFKGYPTEERKTADNPAATVTYKDGKYYFDVPSMKNNPYVTRYASAELSIGEAYNQNYAGYRQFYGTYTGTLTMMGKDFDFSVVISNDSLEYISSSMIGSYSNIEWTVVSSGYGPSAKTTWTLTTYATDDTERTNPRTTFVVSEDTYTWTIISKGSAINLTKSE